MRAGRKLVGDDPEAGTVRVVNKTELTVSVVIGGVSISVFPWTEFAGTLQVQEHRALRPIPLSAVKEALARNVGGKDG